jgi:hypothetical protein
LPREFKENHEKLVRIAGLKGWELNPVSPKYEAVILTIQSWCLLKAKVALTMNESLHKKLKISSWKSSQFIKQIKYFKITICFWKVTFLKWNTMDNLQVSINDVVHICFGNKFQDTNSDWRTNEYHMWNCVSVQQNSNYWFFFKLFAGVSWSFLKCQLTWSVKSKSVQC